MEGHRGMTKVSAKFVDMQKNFGSRNVLETFILECVLCGMLDNVCVLYCCVFSVMRFESVLGWLV